MSIFSMNKSAVLLSQVFVFISLSLLFSDMWLSCTEFLIFIITYNCEWTSEYKLHNSSTLKWTTFSKTKLEAKKIIYSTTMFTCYHWGTIVSLHATVPQEQVIVTTWLNSVCYLKNIWIFILNFKIWFDMSKSRTNRRDINILHFKYSFVLLLFLLYKHLDRVKQIDEITFSVCVKMLKFL